MAIDSANAKIIAGLYISFYDRAPDPVGLQYWMNSLANGVSLSDIADSFAASPEAAATYPYIKYPDLGLSPDDFLGQVYMNVFGRAIDDDGLEYYKARLESGESVGSVMASILGNAATNADGEFPDQGVLANKVAVGLHWASQAVDSGVSIYEADGATLTAGALASAHGVIEGVDETPESVDAANAETDAFFGGNGVGGTFTLTPGDDFADHVGSSRFDGNLPSDFKFTNASETVEATSATLTAGDVLLDNSTTDNDVLKFTGNDLNAFDNATIQNIETFNITLSNADNDADLDNVTGLQSVIVSGSILAGNDGSFYGFADSGVRSFDFSAVTGGAGSNTGAWDSSADQDITVIGSATLSTEISLGDGNNTISTGAGNDVVYVGDGDNSISTGAGADYIEVGIGNNTIDAGDGINEVYVNGDADPTTIDGDNTITTGSGVDYVQIDGDGNNSISTGGASDTVVINGAGDNTIDTGTGNDFVTINGTGDNIIDTGAGNDTIDLAAGTNIVTGGAGVDTITITGGANELVFGAGDSGLTDTTIDIVDGFATGTDSLNFGGPAGTATNFGNSATVVGVGDFDAALAAANSDFTASLGDLSYVVVNDGTDGWVFFDADGNGEADMAISVVGVTALAAADFVA